jgi:hypothetical protein
MKSKFALAVVTVLVLAGSATGAFAVGSLLSTRPLPEPGEWSMILAGFGLIGFMANRRRRPNG